MKSPIFLLISCCVMTSCFAQNTPKDTDSQPKISWDVKKEVDKDGNIIRYDSSYSWSYSNMPHNSVSMDSLYSQFNQKFVFFGNRNNMFSFDNSLFFRNNPFDEEFFNKTWDHHFFDIENMMLDMDSIQKFFFNDPYLPNESKPNSNTKKSIDQ